MREDSDWERCFKNRTEKTTSTEVKERCWIDGRRAANLLQSEANFFSGCKRWEITCISPVSSLPLLIHHLIDGLLLFFLLILHLSCFSLLSHPLPAQNRPDYPVFFFYEREWRFNNTVEYTHDSLSFLHYFSMPYFGLFVTFSSSPPPIIVNYSIFNQIFVYDFLHFLSFNLTSPHLVC